MPRRVKMVPWAASEAGARLPYPRRNVYFTGPGEDELYDYCVWEALRGSPTIGGKPARYISTVIRDTIARRYLKTMREPGNLADFAAWRARHLGPRGGIPLLLVLAVGELLALLPNRSSLSTSLKEWKLGSKGYQDLSRFCELVRKELGSPAKQRKIKAS